MFAESAEHMAGVSCGMSSYSSRRAPPPRQPEERQEYRMSLHKSSSPHWKGAYREVRPATHARNLELQVFFVRLCRDVSDD